MEPCNCEELLSNNPALPVGKMVIKQQILKSSLELVAEMQLDLAVSCCHGTAVPLGPAPAWRRSEASFYSLYEGCSDLCFWGALQQISDCPVCAGCWLQEVAVPASRSQAPVGLPDCSCSGLKLAMGGGVLATCCGCVCTLRCPADSDFPSRGQFCCFLLPTPTFPVPLHFSSRWLLDVECCCCCFAQALKTLFALRREVAVDLIMQ